MSYKELSKDEVRELQTKRQIWRAFFVLAEPVDADLFIAQLKKKDLTIQRSQVYDTFALLIEYGFADRSHNENMSKTFYKCR